MKLKYMLLRLKYRSYRGKIEEEKYIFFLTMKKNSWIQPGWDLHTAKKTTLIHSIYLATDLFISRALTI
jgi:hypothetical protein